jgi:hypothetical protein
MASSSSSRAATSQNVTLPFIPELHNPDFLDILLPASAVVDGSATLIILHADAGHRNTLMDALRGTANRMQTDNGADAYSSTLNPHLDAFQALAPESKYRKLPELLEAAWAEDAELTLRAIWHARSIHDGKGDKASFYAAFRWLFENHPRTAIKNLTLLVEPTCFRRKDDTVPTLSHGYWKDLLNLLVLVALDWPRDSLWALRDPRGAIPSFPPRVNHWANEDKLERAAAAHATLCDRLQDKRFRALYVAVARLFAEQLQTDLITAAETEKAEPESDAFYAASRRLSLAGKWAPSPGGAHDAITNVSTAIALLMREAGVYTPSAIPRAAGVQAPLSAGDAHILRACYGRWALTPLRRAGVVTEALISAGQWSNVNYGRVPAACMNAHTAHFFKHDAERFEAHIEKAERGKKTIAGATLLPHVLVGKALKLRSVDDGTKDVAQARLEDVRERVINAQWASMVGRLREAGVLDNALAVCDVSGSMGSLRTPLRKGAPVEPVLPAVALSLVLAQLAKPPFANAFVTFSRRPELVTVDVEQHGLRRTVHQMGGAHWEMNTDFEAVFVDLLLPVALEHQVPPEDMIRRLFVFSDMQFDAAQGRQARDRAGGWAPTHERIATAYAKAGYTVPEIVYWNLAGQTDAHSLRPMPVTANQLGVALVNGFSPALLKTFMGEEDDDDFEMIEDGGETTKPVQAREQMDPVAVMKKALLQKSFDGLVVVD